MDSSLRLVGDVHDGGRPGDRHAEAVALVGQARAKSDLLAELVVEAHAERRAADEIVIGQAVGHSADLSAFANRQRQLQ